MEDIATFRDELNASLEMAFDDSRKLNIACNETTKGQAMPETESKKQKKVVMDLPDSDHAGKTVYLVKTEDHVAPIEITVQLQAEPVDAWRHTAAKGVLGVIVAGFATKGVEWAYDALIRGIRNRRASDS